MIYRHKVGLVRSFNKKLASTLATLLILASPIMSASSFFVEPIANAAQITNHVVINEVMADPVSGEIEWVELYNPTASSVNMNGWRIRQNASGNFSGVFGASAVIAPHSFLVREKTNTTTLTNDGATLYLETGTNLADTDTVQYTGLDEGESYARTYDGSTDFETRSGSAVTKGTTNGTTPIPTATVNPEEFIATNDTYKGISVGFNVKDFNTVTAISVDMTRADGSHVIKNANASALAIASDKTTSTQLTTPFVIQDGSFTEASDIAFWQPAPALWDSTTRPTSVLISVTDSNGTKTATNNTFNDGSLSWPAYESLLPPAPQTTEIVLADDLAVASNSWGYWIDKFSGTNTNLPTATNTPNKYEIINNPVSTPGNIGAVKLTAGIGDKFNLASLKYINTKLADIVALGYSSYSQTSGNSYLNLDVNFSYPGTPSYQGRLIWEPNSNTPNQWNNYESVASNGSWSWSQFDENLNVWPDGSTQNNRSWNDIVAAFPNAKISGLLYLRADGDISTGATYFDKVYLATNSANVKYNFEIPEVFVNNPSDSSFNYSEMYVRAGNGSDESAIVRVPGQADSVRFNYDGSTDFTDVAGYEHLQAGQWPNSNGDKQFRVKTSLPAGKYHVTAEFRVDGNWYPVTGDETAYSIDIPTATYTTPSATTHFFRVSDNPVKLRVEDQFKQFKYMVVEVNGNKFAVTREQCDLREEGNILFCNVKSAIAQSIAGVDYPAWIPLSEGTYTAKTSVITKANNRVDNLISLPFTIDNTYPTLTNFKVINPSTVYSKNIPVSAEATDANGIEYVKFFITAPKLSDGTCDGNGEGDGIQYGVHTSANTYLATFDTSSLNGYYCLNALSKDSATHTSNPILRMKVKIDNTAPIWDISPVHNSPLNNSNQPVGSNILMQWSDATDESGVKYFYEVSSVSPVTTGEDNHFVSPFYTPFGPLSVSQMDATGTAPGTYYWHVKACDDLDNCTPWTNPWTGTVDEASNTITTPPTINQPNAGSSNPPVITLASFGANAITQLGNAQNFGFQPAQVSDGVVAAVPNTPQVLGASDNKDGSGDVLGDNASDFSKDGFNIMGIAWYYFLAALAAIGGLWWILAAKRRKQNDA